MTVWGTLLFALTNLTWGKVSHLPGEVEISLSGHGDVGEVLLQDKDVPAHLLDAGLADPLEVLGSVYENAGDQMAQAW